MGQGQIRLRPEPIPELLTRMLPAPWPYPKPIALSGGTFPFCASCAFLWLLSFFGRRGKQPGQSHLAKGRSFAAAAMLRPRAARATNGPNAIALGKQHTYPQDCPRLCIG